MAKAKKSLTRVLFRIALCLFALGVIGSFFASDKNPTTESETAGELQPVKPEEPVVEAKENTSAEIDNTSVLVEEKKEPSKDKIVHTQADIERIERSHKRIMDLYQAIERKKTLGFNAPNSSSAATRQKAWLTFVKPWNEEVGDLVNEIGTINGNDPIPENTLRSAAGNLVTLSHPISFNKPQQYAQRREYFLELMEEFNSDLQEFKSTIPTVSQAAKTQNSEALTLSVDAPRIWKDITGEFEVKAVFKGFTSDEEIKLLKEDGTEIVVPFASLGADEQEVAVALQKLIERKNNSAQALPPQSNPDNTRPQKQITPTDLPITENNAELSVVVEKLANSQVRLTGITNLPVGTSLFCDVRSTTSKFIGQSKTVVKENGIYQTEIFGPTTGLKPGKYTASVTCPYRQPKKVRDVIGDKGENLKGPLVRQDTMFGATVSNKTGFSIP